MCCQPKCKSSLLYCRPIHFLTSCEDKDRIPSTGSHQITNFPQITGRNKRRQNTHARTGYRMRSVNSSGTQFSCTDAIKTGQRMNKIPHIWYLENNAISESLKAHNTHKYETYALILNSSSFRPSSEFTRFVSFSQHTAIICLNRTMRWYL